MLGETARLFLKLGILAFGGPSAHIAMLEDEVVERRQWMSRQHFLDLVGATNLIPGPNSTQMMMHVGWERHGVAGLLVAGGLFILPAALLTIFFAWLYVTFGELPRVQPLLSGIKPAIIAVILAAVWRLGKSAVKNWRLALLGTAVLAAILLGVGELPVLFLGALGGAVWLRISSRPLTMPTLFALPLVPASAASLGSETVPEQVVQGATLPGLGLFFLKVGSILYGSGYVLVAFLEGDLVGRFGWLTQDQLLDAIAIGQMTPGPLLTTATFIGYLLMDIPGAIVSTVAIFLPSLVLVPILNPVIPRLRSRPWASLLLDAVNVTAVALMAAVTLRLAGAAATTWPTRLIAVLAILGVLRFKLHAAWLVGGGAALGLLFHYLEGL